jgi:hypothetical protein
MIGKKINQLATELAPVSTDLTIIGDPTTGVSKKITLAQLGAIFSGAVSFYTNLAGFPAVGDINVIYCAKDTQKLYLWSGSAYVEVFPSQALLDTYQLRSEKGNANGYASLDSQGKVPISQLPSSIMEYKGTWNASTNTPTLANGTGDTGDVYICNVAGTVNFGAGPITFAVGDYVIYSGSIWQRSSGAVGTVTSVAVSRSGDALAITGSPVTTSGTINIGFAGNSTQYINGAGNLVTFPGVINEAQNLITEVYNSTGATLTKGTVVYINGGQGNLPTVTKALASGDSTSAQTYGIVQADITNNNNGFVVVAGRLTDIDTQAYANGTQLYLSSTTAGAYTSTKQYAPAHLVYIGIIVRSHPTQGVIEVKIQNGYELDELHNVAAQTPSNNDGLFYESSTSLWKNKSIATVLGYTPANAATYVPYTGATSNVNLGTNDLLSRSVYIEGTASYQAGLLMKQISGFNFVTGAYTQVVPSGIYDLYVVHNQTNGTRRRYAISVASLQDGDDFQYLVPRQSGTFAMTSDIPSLTGYVQGTGTTNYLPKFTGTSTIGNSAVQDDGTSVTILSRIVGINGASESGWGLKVYENLKVQNNNGTTVLQVADTASGGKAWSLISSGSGNAHSVPAGTFYLRNSSDGLTALQVNASGNLGLGVTPSAWNLAGLNVMQIKNGFIYGYSNETSYGVNAYYNGSNWIYISNGEATRYGQNTGVHAWYTAPSGTAGNAISFTQAMTLDASGQLGIGTTSPATKLHIVGNVAMTGANPGIFMNGSAVDQTSLISNANGPNTILKFRAGSFIWVNSDDTERMRITSSGNLSVGNTNDTYKLDVSGTGRFTGNVLIGSSLSNPVGFANVLNIKASDAALVISNTGGTAKNWSIGALQSGSLSVWDGTTLRMDISSTGAATFSNSFTTSDTSAIFLSPSLGTNQTVFLQLGKNIADTYNSGEMSFKFVASGSSSNMVSLGFYGAGQKLNVLGNGNVGIGTTSPSYLLDVNGIGRFSGGYQTPVAIFERNADYGQVITLGRKGVGADAGIGYPAESTLGFYTSANERMRITSGGNVGIGNSSPSYKLDINLGSSYVRAYNNAAGWNFYALGNFSSGGQGGIYTGAGYVGMFSDGAYELSLGYNNARTMNFTSGGNVGIGTTSPATLLNLKSSTTTELRLESVGGTYRSFIGFRTDGQKWDVGVNLTDTNDALSFNSVGSEKVRITSGGDVYIGNSTISTSASAIFLQKSGIITTVRAYSSGTINLVEFYTQSGGGIGTITYNGSAVSYNTTSDYRLKTDYKDFSGLDLVSKIKAYDYEWKSDKSRSYGVIAHELQSVINYAVTGVKDGKEMQGVDYSKIVPVLIKAIQELNDKIK